jgi:hypothetical protein
MRWVCLPVVEGQHFLFDPASLSVLGYAARHPGVRVIALWNGSPASVAGKQ